MLRMEHRACRFELELNIYSGISTAFQQVVAIFGLQRTRRLPKDIFGRFIYDHLWSYDGEPGFETVSFPSLL